MKEVLKAHAWALAVALGLLMLLATAGTSLATPVTTNASPAAFAAEHDSESASDEDEQEAGDADDQQDSSDEVDLRAAGVRVHVDETGAEATVGASGDETSPAQAPTQTLPTPATSSPPVSAAPSTPKRSRSNSRGNRAASRKKTQSSQQSAATATASSVQTSSSSTPAPASAAPSARSVSRHPGDTRKQRRPRRTVVRRIVDRVPPAYRLALFGVGTLAAGFALAGMHARRRARRAESEALIDPLTGLANRRAFDRRLEEEWKRSERYDRPLGLVMIDLDGFKQINDTRGHKEGDRVLREAAARIADRLRAIDLAARLGGDEFAALCPETPGEGLESLAGSLESCLDGLPVGASIGFAERQPGDQNAPELLSRADEAMYRQKQEHARHELLGAAS
jgi:diguanylate cyclase (GGDEF)-like protein